jgi:hypothetical protein
VDRQRRLPDSGARRQRLVPDEAVDKLVSVGEALVRDSEVLAEFKRSLEGVPPAVVSGGQ